MTNFEKYYRTHGVDRDGFFASFKKGMSSDKEFLKVKNHKEFIEFMLKEADDDEADDKRRVHRSTTEEAGL